MRLALLFSLWSWNALAGGSGFAGNGGNGILLDGKLYVEDLWSGGVEKAPFVGEARDPALPALPDSSSISFPYPKELLARKLTDLNRAYPGIGDYVLLAMKQYTWVLEDFPLVPVPDPEEPVALPPGARIVQIANRWGNTIRVHSGSFAQLDEVNQVALLVHEAIYSLVSPLRTKDGSMRQPAYAAREIVASFFNPAFLGKSRAEILAALDPLSIPHDPLTLAEIRQSPSWNLSYGKDEGPDPVQLGSVSVDFSREPSASALESALARVCESVATRAKEEPAQGYWVNSVYQLRPVRVSSNHYLADDATEQVYVEVSLRYTGPWGESATFKSVDDCTAAFPRSLAALEDSL